MGGAGLSARKSIERVRSVEASRDDYEPAGKPGEKPQIHDKVLRAIQEEIEGVWRSKLGDYGIDLVIRETYPSGRILLAVEVDTWWKPPVAGSSSST